MGEDLMHHEVSIAAPIVFIMVTTFKILSKWLEHKKKETVSSKETQLRVEIKQLSKEANSLSGPSTFAQSAKLKRLAAAKEKELSSYQESRNKEMKMSYEKVLLITKVFAYFVLLCWFWNAPVATIPQQLVQPFGRILSWKAGESKNNHVMVGIIPWLLVSTRVSKLVGRLYH